MGYAPTLALLEPARAAGHRRIAMIGIPCQVYALRALEAELGLERLYVIGTPCSDNTTTENFHIFLNLLDSKPQTVSYLEFRADFRVELRFDDGRPDRIIPFLQLPISQLPPDFFPITCKTCVDYTNRLADITVGYMGGQGEQWLLVRNARHVVSRADIVAHVWDDNHDPLTNAVEVYVNRLRGKIDREPFTPLLHTRRGVGYVLTDIAPV
jgi:coenzyme F420 hydrogenase subunit beta